ncbi:MAG: transketolase, partial [Gammaproteobacteria bacterium]|nr:transketolase [Gammaproteobacteria bacterium]
GCLMEGISHEAASFAGTLGLGKLIAFWDDNNISIDGEVGPWFSENTAERFRAYGWQVINNVDGHNSDEIETAIKSARSNSTQPSLICCKTIIGFGAPNKQNTESSHGSPLGAAEITASREFLNWPYKPFEIPLEYYKNWDARQSGQAAENNWQELFSDYQKDYPELAQEYLTRMRGELSNDFINFSNNYILDLQFKINTEINSNNHKNLATRQHSQNILTALGPKLPGLFGGSADLTGSNGTLWKTAKIVNSNNWDGQYLHYGVREFAMTAICNGLALYGGFIPYGGTFLTFLDYGRNAVRLAALMQIQNILVYTHDSIALGEDGPTHQPIEHLAMLRVTPNLDCWRPCDAVETAVAWQQAIISHNKPSALILTRQAVQSQVRSDNLDNLLENISKGGYILADFENNNNIKLIIIATGSEVELAMGVRDKLKSTHNIRVVSMPCLDRFKIQPDDYKNAVLANNLNKNINNILIIEAGAKMPWFEFVSSEKYIIGIDRFGESAPAGDLLEFFGFTVQHIAEYSKKLFKN